MQYLKVVGVRLDSEIRSIKKKADSALHPLFEAMQNSFESLMTRFSKDDISAGTIELTFVYSNVGLKINPPIINLERIDICDNGVGLNDDAFVRLQNLRDESKGYKNKGTGRIQFVHSFDKTVFESYSKSGKESTSALTHRKVVLSKCPEFLSQNSLLRVDADETSHEDASIGLKVSFFKPLDNKDLMVFNDLSAREVKDAVIKHFLSFFCDRRDKLPQISIAFVISDKVCQKETVVDVDIPKEFVDVPFDVQYSKVDDFSKVIDLSESEQFRLKGFCVNAEGLDRNEVVMVSKGAASTRFDIDDISAKDKLDGSRYLFLLSGEYIDAHDSDTRGDIEFITEKELIKQEPNLFPKGVILFERLKLAANVKIRENCQRIAEKKNERESQVDKLMDMFMLDPDAVAQVRSGLKITDNDEVILKKIYHVASDSDASKDAKIKAIVDDLNKLNPADKQYADDLKSSAQKLAKLIPVQNRNTLTKYVARRKLVLDLFDRILKCELDASAEKGNVDEDMLHNLLFKQHSDSPEDSDLWLINEEMVYFNGASDRELEKLEYKGHHIFGPELSERAMEYLNSNGEKRLKKRPDVLLFPEEGKCVIVEFKAPNVNVAKHISQINVYATMLYNFTLPQYNFHEFYGYLIGENVQDWDVRAADSSYVKAPGFDYWYRTGYRVPLLEMREDKNGDGGMYSEILKYSTLLQRAIKRNKVFIDKLGLDGDSLSRMGESL